MNKNYILFFGVFIFIFIITNIVSWYLIKINIGYSMFDKTYYDNAKFKYHKPLGQDKIAHPFVGVRLAGGSSEDIITNLTNEKVFESSTISKNENDIKILILGGSVAHRIVLDDFYKMINDFFNTDRFSIYNSSAGGIKQPEQYFIWTYLDFLGFEPDIVINIDGFNEIALPLVENYTLGNPPIFPRSYSRLLHATNSDRSCAEKTNKLVSKSSFIPLLELFNWYLIQRCHFAIEGSSNEIPWWSESIVGNDQYEDFLEKSINIWYTASNKLNEDLNEKNIDYIHVLQANQYLENSKSLSDVEKEKFLNLPLYGNEIKKHYSKLNSKMIKNINFIDQRYLFKNISDTVYLDNCCHFNKFGNNLIAKDIFEKNKQIFKRRLNK